MFTLHNKKREIQVVNTYNLKTMVAGGALAFAVFSPTATVAQASKVSITSEDGSIDVIGFTDYQECKGKYYEKCINVIDNCGGATIYVSQNISKILHHYNKQGTHYDVGPKGGYPYCSTRP